MLSRLPLGCYPLLWTAMFTSVIADSGLHALKFCCLSWRKLAKAGESSLPMSVLGVGCDVVHLPRMHRLLTKYDAGSRGFQRVVSKFMHPTERIALGVDGASLSAGQIRYIAGTWALKEAALKALHCAAPLHTVLPPAMFIYTKLLYRQRRSNGVPQLLLDNEALRLDQLQFLRQAKFLSTLSHDNEYLVAYTTLIDTKNLV